jgi:hypothetical protein
MKSAAFRATAHILAHSGRARLQLAREQLTF